MSVPYVLRTSPVNSEQGISTTPTITVEWSCDVDEASVQNEDFYFTRVSDRTVITATASELVSGAVVSFEASEPLDPGTEHTVTITPGIESVTGESSPRSYSWNFTTGIYSTLLAPVIMEPIDGELVDETYTIEWNGDGDIYQIQVATDRIFTDPVIDTNSISVNNFILSDSALIAATTYFLRVRVFSDGTPSPWSNIISVIYKMPVRISGAELVDGDLWTTSRSSFSLIRVQPLPGTANKTPGSIILTFNKAPHANTLTEGTDQYAPPTLESLNLLTGVSTETQTGWTISGDTLVNAGPFLSNTTYYVYLSAELQSVDGDVFA